MKLVVNPDWIRARYSREWMIDGKLMEDCPPGKRYYTESDCVHDRNAIPSVIEVNDDYPPVQAACVDRTYFAFEEVPSDVVDAAIKVAMYFKAIGVSKWEFMDLRSRYL